MKVEIEVDGLHATIENNAWQGDASLLPRVIQADAEAGFLWHPIGGGDYSTAQAVAKALGGTVLTPLPTNRDEDDSKDGDIIY